MLDTDTDTDPVGAVVFVDGKLVGAAPVTHEVLRRFCPGIPGFCVQGVCNPKIDSATSTSARRGINRAGSHASWPTIAVSSTA